MKKVMCFLYSVCKLIMCFYLFTFCYYSVVVVGFIESKLTGNGTEDLKVGGLGYSSNL